MPSTRRLLTLGGAAFVGLAATALFAAPASAHAAKLTYDVECKANGTAKVTWHIENDHNTTATLKDVAASPALEKIVNGAKIKSGQTLSESVTVKAGETATLTYIAKWPDNWTYAPPGSATQANTGKCAPECPPSVGIQGGHPSPSPSCPAKSSSPRPSTSAKPSHSASAKPSASASARPSGSGSPTPTSTDTPPGPSSSTPALPVTGAQTAAYAGGSLLLLGAGAGLFFIARRRRIKFEA
jgi:LPXTG-motif cell wall-anchored protein